MKINFNKPAFTPPSFFKKEKAVDIKNSKNKFQKFVNFSKEKYGLSYIGIYSMMFALLLILGQGIFFLNKKQNSSSQKNELQTKINQANDAIEAAKKVQKNSAVLSANEKMSLTDSLKIDLTKSMGMRIDSVSVDEKIPVPGQQKIYYKVSMNYSVKDLDALKNLLALIYIHPKVVKITDVDNGSIKVIMTNQEIEE